jgi:ABC-type antimicrobial peptide transport system permease subunit
VRTTGEPEALIPAIRDVLAALDPRIAIYDARPLASYVDAARSSRRFVMQLVAAFALSALALTCIGIYGVLAFAVAVRRHELGVRGVLGAAAGQMIRDVLREGLGLATVGCAGGLVAAVAAAHLLRNQLYAVQPHDSIAYAAAVLLIGIGAALACWIPAHRATTVSPIEALRAE